MNTKVRPELSTKNPYWIDKHRYYELKHFCLQYPTWKKMRGALNELGQHPIKEFIPSGETSDPTAKYAEKRAFYSSRIEMIEKIAEETDAELGTYILKGVTQGIPYNILRVKENVPCCKDVYYELYRRFFWLLSEARR